MTPLTIGILATIFFLVILLLGVPVSISMLISGFIGMTLIIGPAKTATLLASDLMTTFSTYAYSTIPMFGLMGFLAYYSGVGGRLFDCVNAFIGHRHGGLAMATEAASAIFGAICGSPTACIGTMCAIAYPEMRKKGYSPSLAGPAIASGCMLAVMIPPSSSFIIYGLITENSIGRLFISGIIPGIVLCIMYIICISVMVRRNPEMAPNSRKYSMKERWEAVRKSNLLVILIVFIISMGGMFAGFFTPTEAGAIGSFAMLIVTICMKKMDWKRFWRSLTDALRMMGMIYFLLATAVVLSHMFTVSGLTAALSKLVLSLNVSRMVILFLVVLILFVLGMFTEILSTLLITTPIFYPLLVTQLGFDPVWFGTVQILIASLGGMTPPVGTNIFVVKGSVSWDKEATLTKLYKGVWPFVITEIAFFLLITIFPQICTFLPNLVFGPLA